MRELLMLKSWPELGVVLASWVQPSPGLAPLQRLYFLRLGDLALGGSHEAL